MAALRDLSADLCTVDAGRDKSGDASAVPVPINALRSGFSLRLEGENLDHVRVLSEADDLVPPILVHRPSMRIIDGMHRLRAATQRGMDTILVEFFDGDEDSAYLLALKRNTAHGYPLTTADRETAVCRVLDAHPEWSDRIIADATGISARTVGVIRRRSATGRPDTRLGKDGRIRPLDAADGRLRASHLLKEHPTAPLREIATKAGISLSTAHDVRRRLRNGQTPLPSRQRSGDEDRGVAVPRPRTERSLGRRPRVDHIALVTSLKNDPSLRLNEAGRKLLRLLDTNALWPTDEWDQLAESIPDHWLDAISVLAGEYAKAWRTLATQLHRRQARP